MFIFVKCFCFYSEDVATSLKSSTMSATTSIGGLPGWAIGVIELGAVIGAIAVLAILAGAKLAITALI